KTQSGFFFVLKYVEYFVVYYMVVNNLRDRPHAWRMVGVAFVTAAIVSLVGIAQIPSGDRVSAPFEGEVGEPNTFGGYLLIMMAIAAGIALETRRFRARGARLPLVSITTLPLAAPPCPACGPRGPAPRPSPAASGCGWRCWRCSHS